MKDLLDRLATAEARAERWFAVAKVYYDMRHYSIDITVNDNPDMYVFDRADVDACDDAYDAAEAAEGGV